MSSRSKSAKHPASNAQEPSQGLAPGEVVLGHLVSLSASGSPVVRYEAGGKPETGIAVSTLPVSAKHVGRQVAILFATGDKPQPVIMGFIHNPLNEILEAYPVSQVRDSLEDESVFDGAEGQAEPAATGSEIVPVQVDGKRLHIEGQEEVVLSCGNSSITLTKAGKIIIRGKYLVSRATGVNRILGGSVQVN
jgi:hypothetical protein